jgi:hypothetical protein
VIRDPKKATLYGSLLVIKETDAGGNAMGLRFFTVYGPWGNPTWLFLFSPAQSRQTSRSRYSTTVVWRAIFTYIDDIVEDSCVSLTVCRSRTNCAASKPNPTRSLRTESGGTDKCSGHTESEWWAPSWHGQHWESPEMGVVQSPVYRQRQQPPRIDAMAQCQRLTGRLVANGKGAKRTCKSLRCA